MRFFLQSAFLSAIQNIYKAIKNFVNKFKTSSSVPSQPPVSDAVKDQTSATSTSNETSALEKTTADRLASSPHRLSPFDLSDLTTRIFQQMPLEENRWLRTVSKSFLLAWEHAAKLHLFHPRAIPSLGIDNGITLYDKQKEEIDHLMRNQQVIAVISTLSIDNDTLYDKQKKEIDYLIENQEAILERDDVDEIRAAFDKLATFKENKDPIAFYARETHLNTINEFIIRANIAVAQDDPEDAERLNCADSRLTRFPESVLKDKALEGFWRGLTVLNLNNNQLHALPDAIGMLSALKVLYVDNNKLSVLPSTIGELSALEVLCVFLNGLKALPDTIGKLSSLKTLNVSNNRLSVLPDTIGDLTLLINLYARSNPLSALPNTIGKLNALEELHVNCAELDALPDTIGQLKKLKHLRVQFNKLTVLPDTIIECAALEELNVVQNHLCNIPDQLREDIFVDMFDNRINKKACLKQQKTNGDTAKLASRPKVKN
ncbi:MAG: leucine-rich repeat domain-containing protein [Proteobacteria bacterium]|nr:leucine-rich repeat domain-containing protein [Pseudomonadota bacterium]